MQNAKIVHNLVVYSGNNIGFITNNRATVDEMFQSNEMEQWLLHKGLDVLWKADVFSRLVDSADSYSNVKSKGIKAVRVWRLKKAQEGHFFFLNDFRKSYGEPCESQYESIYQEEMGTENLEKIYEHLSQEKKELASAFSYPLSVSDVIELFDQSGREFFFIDRYDFEPIQFIPA